MNRCSSVVASVAVLGLAEFSSVWAQTPSMPKSPVTINVIDVAGDLALTQAAIEGLSGKASRTCLQSDLQ